MTKANLQALKGLNIKLNQNKYPAMQLKKCGRKGCEIFALRVEDMRDPINTTYGDDYIFEDGEIREKLKESFE